MPNSADAVPAPVPPVSRVRRTGWLALGLILIGIGLVGLFVPLLPTVDFLILALPCFARSSPRLEAWLLDHPRFGAAIRAWRAERAIPQHAKLAACIGMATGFALLWWLAHPPLWIAAPLAAILLAAAGWIVRRPSPQAVTARRPA